MPAEHQQELLDTSIMILRKWVDPDELSAEVAISAITLAELSAGPREVRRNEDQDDHDEHAERARRTDVLQQAENEFDPSRAIAAITIAKDLPLFTTNPDDFKGLEDLLTVVPVRRPAVLHDR